MSGARPLRGPLHLVLVALPWIWFLVRDLDPVLDMVALGLPVIVAAAAVTALVVAGVRRRWEPLVTAASWLVFGAVVVVGPWTPQPSEAPVDGIRIVAANTYGSHSDTEAVIAQIVEQRPAVLVVSEEGVELSEALGARYGSSAVALRDRKGRGDPALYSHLPMTDLGLPPSLAGQRGVRVRVDGPAGPFIVYGLHLYRPRFGPSSDLQVSVRAHVRATNALAEAVAAEILPVVVTGDLNLVDRSSGYRRLTGHLDDAIRAGWARPTALRSVGLPFLPRIDHLLVSDGWCRSDAAIFELSGSDHRGVAATVGRCR